MYIKQLFGKDVVRNTTTVLSGNAIAQIISLAIYPLLTRIYSPDDFGVLTIFLSLGGIWIIIAGAEYYNAVMLPKSKERAVACFQVSLITIILVSVICAISIALKDLFVQWYNSEKLGEWYFLLPFYVLFSALWILMQHWYGREKNFKAISGYQIGLSSVNAGMKSGFGFAGLTSGGMIWSMTIAPLITLVVNVFIHLKNSIKDLFTFDWGAIRHEASVYSNFPKYAMPRMLLHYTIGVLPALILSPYFSIEQIGFYGMAVTLSQKPVTMCTQSMYSVLFQKISKMVNDGIPIAATIRKYIIYILAVTIPSFTVLYFTLPWLTSVLLGEEWRYTGELIQVMLVFLASMLVTSTLNFIPDIFQKQKTTLLFEIVNLLCSLSAIFIGMQTNNFHTVITLLFQAYALVWVAEGFWIYHLVKMYDRQLKQS
ncbi:MAG: oligosaccharide flippase family protein [Paludibacteraceae bacterium]|nr:oligosaccharide flippase family protein [Paludibacteraceae bacterium]